MLVIDHASKSYDKKKKALDDVSLTIQPGDLFGFVGHNGAGKTTLLKAISGIHQLDQGSIKLGDLDINQDPLAFKSQIAYVPDHPDLYEQLTGRQYIDFIADVFKVSITERQALIQQYGGSFDMLPFLKQPISTYSHGMKQKTALIAALIHRPRLLLLDEPFVGLDPKASFVLKEVFKTMTQSGMSIFFSSHVLEVVEKLTNKIAIIKQGKIIHQGLTKEVLGKQNLESLFMELS
ncbi:MAG: ABC transporter ATP-binding protein [Bacilli bacterium]